MFLHDGSISIELDNLKNQSPFDFVTMLSPIDLQPFDNSLINIFFSMALWFWANLKLNFSKKPYQSSIILLTNKLLKLGIDWIVRYKLKSGLSYFCFDGFET